jgi:hypothetical protein
MLLVQQTVVRLVWTKPKMQKMERRNAISGCTVQRKMDVIHLTNMSTRTMNVGLSRSVDASRKNKLLFLRHVLFKHQPYSTTFGCKMVQCPPKMNASIAIPNPIG